MDIVTYALCKKITASALSGITDIRADGTNLIITTKDGQAVTMTFPVPKDGVKGDKGDPGISITEIKIDENSHLIFTLSDGSITDVGKLPSSDNGEGFREMTDDEINDLIAEINR